MNPEELINNLKNKWINHGGYKPPLIGCTQEDIKKMCASQQVKHLPELYIQFMLAFGKASGGLQGGGEFKFPSVLDFKQHWETILPSPDCFVFITNNDDFALSLTQKI